jgi:hypothetical protein
MAPVLHRATLESELRDVLHSCLTPKLARAAARRLGWLGAPPATLADAGAQEGYTRERVRQLEQRARAHVARHRPPLPCTAAAARLIAHEAPVERGDVAVELVRVGLAMRPFDPAGVITAATLSGLACDLAVEGAYVLRARDTHIAREALTAGRKLAERGGAAHVGDVALAIGSSRPIARRLLEGAGAVMWLDDFHDWFIVSPSRSRVEPPLRKMLALARRLTVADAEGGLARTGIRLPRPVLRAAIERIEWAALDRTTDVVSAVVALDPTRLLTAVERTLVEVFRTSGPVLRFTELQELAEAAGVCRSTAGVYLGRSPVLQTVSRGVHALRGYGADIVPIGLREEARPAEVESEALSAG